MNWPPHITVATIVTLNDQFLFVEEQGDGAQTNSVINQPAGHLEPAESMFEAAVRETLEETGWQVDLQAIVGLYQYHSPENDVLYHRVCFSAKPVRQTNKELDPDIRAIHWLTREQLLEKNLRSPLVLLCLDDFLKGNLQPLSFLKHI